FPPVPPEGKTRQRILLTAAIGSGATGLLTVIIAIANWRSAVASRDIVTQTKEDKDTDKLDALISNKVLEIVDESRYDQKGNPIPDYKGMTFNEILTKYKSIAADSGIPREELEPFALKKTLYGLQSLGTIHRTIDDRF